MKRVAVIGTGPSGWATAKYLAELNLAVDIISSDIKREDVVDGIVQRESHKINRKLLMGSDYPYRDFPAGPKIINTNVSVDTSFAFSGLSLVWGATMLPFSHLDLKDQEIGIADLDFGYRWIAGKVPIAGRIDALADIYEPYISRPPLLPSRRILSLLENSRLHNNESFKLGSSRLAVSSQEHGKVGCTYCGKCLSGCPIDIIWKSPQIAGINVNYRLGLRALEIAKKSSSFSVKVVNTKGHKHYLEGYDRIFLGTGPVESFRILAESGFVSKHAKLMDSQTFFVPMLLSPKYGKIDLSSNTLSQVFAHLTGNNQTLSQLQIYDYSDDLVERVNQLFKLAVLIPDKLIKLVLTRLFIGIGYLSSGDSAEIEMMLDDSGNVLLSTSSNLSHISKVVDSVVTEYSKKLRGLGIFPLRILTQKALPGQGVHFGGWLPLGTSSDRLGQPHGTRGIHVVDSSSFSRIPAGPITYSIMANAVRIVRELYS